MKTSPIQKLLVAYPLQFTLNINEQKCFSHRVTPLFKSQLALYGPRAKSPNSLQSCFFHHCPQVHPWAFILSLSSPSPPPSLPFLCPSSTLCPQSPPSFRKPFEVTMGIPACFPLRLHLVLGPRSKLALGVRAAVSTGDSGARARGTPAPPWHRAELVQPRGLAARARRCVAASQPSFPPSSCGICSALVCPRPPQAPVIESSSLARACPPHPGGGGRTGRGVYDHYQVSRVSSSAKQTPRNSRSGAGRRPAIGM